ncbi:MAG: dihydrodipicolinate synthase family protein [Acidobacteria bacterium]|nr:dihydrodipicolinate synthase family protein [Acidobacteriota bacterium]
MLDLSGILAPVTTPFGQDGTLDLGGLRANFDRWNRTGLAGYVVLGSNGEAVYLSETEKWTVVEAVRGLVPSTKRLMVGINTEGTREAIRQCRQAAELGAEAVLVSAPSYFKSRMTADAFFVHFWSVADESPVPVLVYSVPQFTGVSIPPGTVGRLASHENIAGMKESSGSLTAIADFLSESAGQAFQVLCGAGPILLASLALGAVGGIVALACAAPEICVRVFEVFRWGDVQGAQLLQAALTPASIAVTDRHGIPGLKAAMESVGFVGGHCRLPLLQLSEEAREEIVKTFAALRAEYVGD